MIILVKILFVALAVIGQTKLFPEGKEPVETEFERTALPVDHPELVLARRAMKAEGLCDSPARPGDSAAGGEAQATDVASLPPAVEVPAPTHLAESCF